MSAVDSNELLVVLKLMSFNEVSVRFVAWIVLVDHLIIAAKELDHLATGRSSNFADFSLENDGFEV